MGPRSDYVTRITSSERRDALRAITRPAPGVVNAEVCLLRSKIEGSDGAKGQWKKTPASMFSTWPVTLSERQNAAT